LNDTNSLKVEEEVMKNRGLIAVVIVTVLSSILAIHSAAQRQGFPLPPPDGQDFPPFGPRGGRGGPNAQDIKIVKQFDKNNDGWLNAAERKTAREYARNVGRGGFPGRGGPRGGRGGESGPAGAGKTITPADVKTYPSAPFYDESVLRTVFITFEGKDWESELEDFHGTDVDVAANVMIDGKTYRDVGIRFRGMSSMMVPEGRKHSLNLSIDMAHENQSASGYRTLNFLNSHEDPTMMRAVLFLHIARQYIPAPKANFVRVVINGENWGIYQNVQQFNKEFLKENFNSTDGARWKAPGPNPQAGLMYLGDAAGTYKQAYEIKSKDDAAQWAALIELCRLLNQTPTNRITTALSPVLDIDSALRFLALDNALVNNDGYWSRASDYSLYRDMAGKFHIIPHDANETFGAGPAFGPRGGPGGPGGPGGRGPGGPGFLGGTSLDPLGALDAPLRAKLLAVPELRQKYMGYVRDIATKWLDWKAMGPVVEGYKTLIEADVKADTKRLETYEAFVQDTTGTTRSLKTFAAARREYLLSR
jgi:spore coat protein CotH